MMNRKPPHQVSCIQTTSRTTGSNGFTDSSDNVMSGDDREKNITPKDGEGE